MGLTPTTEDYLQAIHAIRDEGPPVIAARLAERLHVTAASVSQTVDRMVRQGLVEVSEDHQIGLTAEGQREAAFIIRRHRLTERFLTDILHMDWVEAHEEAHRLEHGMSLAVERRLSAFLGDPPTCPHGAPIPGNFPEGGAADWVRLATCEQGEMVEIRRVSEAVEDDRDLLAYCDQKHLHPGTQAEVVEKSPDDVMVLRQGDESVAISPRLSTHIYVVRV